MRDSGVRTNVHTGQVIRATPRSVLLWRGPTWWLPPLLVVCGSILLPGLFFLPLTILRDFGSRQFPTPGLYPPERNQYYSYAYTNGDTPLEFPEIGTGRFMVSLRMGGPNESVTVAAHLTSANPHVDLGSVTHARTYHLLLPADRYGDLDVHIRSTTTVLAPDPRELGAFLDRIAVRSTAAVWPPRSVLVAGPIIWALLWLTVTQLQTTTGRKTLLLLALSTILVGSYVLGRGRIAVQAWWLAGSGLGAALVSLRRFDGRQFATPLRGVAALFIAWRLGLWLAGAVALWYSDGWYVWGTSVTFSGTILDRTNFAWKTLAGGWLHWDGRHYQSIATEGYTFVGADYPTVAFFPLYPLLIRLAMPLTGGSVALAALLVSHVALFAALLLLYDLLAHDFGPTVAWRTILLLLVFPTSLFFGAAYSESLALLLVVAVLGALRRRHWWLAGVAGGLLALARLPGIMLTPLLALAYLSHHRWEWRAVRLSFLAVLLPLAGLALFMLFQSWRFGTPWAFLQAQQAWYNHLSMPWTQPYDLLMAIVSGIDRGRRIVQLVLWAGFAGLTLLAVLRLPMVYGLAALLLLLPPYLGSWSESLSRHILIAFPTFVMLACLPGNDACACSWPAHCSSCWSSLQVFL